MQRFSAKICADSFFFLFPETNFMSFQTASIGNDGAAPCIDCVPPMEWICARGHATSFRKTQCDTCQVFLPARNSGQGGEEPLRQFCATAQEAFTLTLRPHTYVRPFGSQATLTRVPFNAPTAFQEIGLDLPCGKEMLLALREPLTSVLVGESKMDVSTINGLPSDQILTEFCTEVELCFLKEGQHSW